MLNGWSPGRLPDEDEESVAWALEARGESELRRLDRHFVELLQELRIAQTGVQILFAFLLGLAFTPRFVALSTHQHVVYLVTLVLAACSAAVLIAPVSYHRAVYGRQMRAELVQAAHRCAVSGLALLLLALVGAVHLAATFVIGDWAALLAGVLFVLFIVLWYVVPVRKRLRQRGSDASRMTTEPAGSEGQWPRTQCDSSAPTTAGSKDSSDDCRFATARGLSFAAASRRSSAATPR